MNTILVFKTSVTKVAQVRQLSPYLNQLLCPQGKWNFDLEDCDRILRIEASERMAKPVQTLLHAHNHYCIELE